MEENKKINYLMVTSVKNKRRTICKSEFPVSVGDLVNVRDQEADAICMVDAVVISEADSDVAAILNAFRSVDLMKITKVWKLTSSQ